MNLLIKCYRISTLQLQNIYTTVACTKLIDK